MKALTIWQPWATLIIAGAKPFEFRGWCPPASAIGKRIAIHAGARKMKLGEIEELLDRLDGDEAWSTGLITEVARPILQRALINPEELYRSCVLGTAVLGEPIRASMIVELFGGPVNDSDREEHSNWAWPMKDIEPLFPPEPARGGQGLWEWRP